AGADAPDLDALAATIVERAARDALAPLDGLAGDRVLAVHGRHDQVVPETIARASLEIYAHLPEGARPELRWDGEGDFAHVWPTLAPGGDCGTTAAPYIGQCGRDFAGEAMQALYGEPLRAVAEQAAAP